MLRSIIIKVTNAGVRSARSLTRPTFNVYSQRYCTQNHNHDHSGEQKVRVRYAPSPTGKIQIKINFKKYGK